MKECAILLLICSITTQAVEKPYQLVMLNIVQTGAMKPQNGRTCRATAQYVLDKVNNQTEVLPDYHLTMQNQDEGGGDITPRIIVNFSRSFETNDSKVVYQAPIVTGPFQSTACKAIGTFLQHLNLTTISTACGATELTNHNLYPNLYLMASSVPLVMGMVHFLKDVGNWTRIAIITTPYSVLDYSTTRYFEREAKLVGLSVPYFAFAPDMDDEQMTRLKESGSRIIAMYVTNATFTCNFLCQAYKFGLTGPRYLFLFRLAFMDPYQLPEVIFPGCLRSTIIEQMKYTFFSYGVVQTFKGQEENAAKFENWLNIALNYTQPNDYQFKDLCHDTYMRAIVALDRADKTLQHFNMSLRDFRTNPEFVMRIVNQSAANTNYSGLELFRPHKLGQGSPMILGSINYWTSKGGLQMFHRTEQLPTADETDFNSYSLIPVERFDWASYGGRPPIDGQIKTVELSEMPQSIFITVLSIGCIAITANLAFITEAIRNFQSRSKIFGYAGCIVLDVAAILFSTETNISPYAIWVARIAVLVPGITAVNSVLSLRAICLFCCLTRRYNEVTKRKGVRIATLLTATAAPTKRFRFGRDAQKISPLHPDLTCSSTIAVHDMTFSQLVDPITEEEKKRVMEQADILAVITSSIGLAIHSAVMLIWLTSDPLRCSVEIWHQKYVPDKDIELTITQHVCQSQGQSAWISAMTASQISLFLFALLSLFTTQLRYPDCPELSSIRFGSNNTLVTLLPIILILVILHGRQVPQLITISFGALAVSVLASLTWSFESILASFKRRNMEVVQN